MKNDIRNKKDEFFWLNKLSGITQEQTFKSVLPQAHSGNRHFVRKEIETDLTEKIAVICQGMPLHTIALLLQVLQTLRWHYTTRNDFVTFLSIPALSGTFGRTTDIFNRFHLNPEASFKEALAALLQHLQEDVQYSHVNRNNLEKKLEDNYGIDPVTLYAAGVGYGDEVVIPDNFCELYFHFQETGGRLALTITDVQGHYSADTLESIAHHFSHILRSCVHQPDTPVQQLSLLPIEELRLIEQYLTGPVIEYPLFPNIICSFFEMARECPHATALVCGDQKIAYGELKQRANAIAAWLLYECESAPGELIGILMDRSPDMVATLIGVLQSGAAFVPIDPQLPSERIQYILNDTGLKTIIVQSAYLHLINRFQGTVLQVDKDTIVHGIASDQLQVDYNHADLAYVIYTSGSTGNPKGVMITHQGFINMLNWYIREYSFSNNDRVLIFTSPSFDLTLKNIFAPLSVGGTIVLPEQLNFEPRIINDLIKRETITFINCTPFNFYLLVDGSLDPEFKEKLRSLRVLIVGGEAINMENLCEWLEDPDRTTMFVNTYGCTECSDIASSYNLMDYQPFFKAPVPAGRPIPNTSIYILNDLLRPVPPGFIGELFNAGVGVGAGYWNNPVLTAERFMPDRFNPQQKMYRTGDLVRLNSEGLVEFVDRKDQQVKIRGNRVELQEIEQALLTHPQVQKSVVIPRKDGRQYTYLAAYIIAEEAVNPKDLRDFLLGSLPVYMVPDYFTRVKAFPLNGNGKLDRTQLPDPTTLIHQSDLGDMPLTETEQKLSAIWQTVFSVDEVNALDNFFALGGNSLRAVQVAAKIEQQLGQRVSIATVFNNPTIKELASVLTPNVQPEQESQWQRLPQQPYYMVSQSQKRIWVQHQLETGHSIAYNVQVVEIIREDVNLEYLQQAINQLIKRHEALRTAVSLIQDEPVQVIQEQAYCEIKYHVCADTGDALEEASAIIRRQLKTPFNLEEAPLVNVMLLKTGAQQYILSIVLHHIICDGWSVNVLLKDLQQFYHAAKLSRTITLPPLTLQYKEYAAWHNNLLNSDTARKQRAYWHKKLAVKASDSTGLLDYKRGPVKQFDPGLVSFSIPRQQTEAIRALGRQTNASDFIVLCAAVKVYLFKLTGNEDVTVGSTAFGRPGQVFEQVIGMFVNTLVLKDRLEEHDSFLTVLEKVKTTVLESAENQDYPFDWLVDELLPNRDRSRNPFFDMMVSFNDFVEEHLLRDEVSVKNLVSGNGLLKYDMSWVFAGRENLYAAFFYDASLFNRMTVEAFKDQFLRVLEGVLQNADIAIGTISMNVPYPSPVSLSDDFRTIPE